MIRASGYRIFFCQGLEILKPRVDPLFRTERFLSPVSLTYVRVQNVVLGFWVQGVGGAGVVAARTTF